jgi:hypothetical protein
VSVHPRSNSSDLTRIALFITLCLLVPYVQYLDSHSGQTPDDVAATLAMQTTARQHLTSGLTKLLSYETSEGVSADHSVFYIYIYVCISLLQTSCVSCYSVVTIEAPCCIVQCLIAVLCRSITHAARSNTQH